MTKDGRSLTLEPHSLSQACPGPTSVGDAPAIRQGPRGVCRPLCRARSTAPPPAPMRSQAPWGNGAPAVAPWGGENGVRAHLPHKVLDAAQLALDAGSVQQRLPHVIAPVPLRGHQRA